MQTATKIALVAFVLTLVFGYGIISTTPPGDKDSHGFMLLKMLLTMLPIGVCVSLWGVIAAHLRRRGRVLAWVALSLFVVPAAALGLLITW